MSEPGTRLEEITANATTQGASAPDVCSVDSASATLTQLAAPSRNYLPVGDISTVIRPRLQ
jgi:hypothetical protein